MHINVTGIGGFILLALDIWALISVIGSNETTGKKVIWVLVILFLPLIGFIAWLIFGPRAAGPDGHEVKLFACQNCGQLLHFENTVCMRCGRPLGFLPEKLGSRPSTPTTATVTAMADGSRWRPAPTSSQALCNWLVPADSDDGFCAACALNRTIPDLSIAGNLERWQALEAAKRRLIYALCRLGLPLANRNEDGEPTASPSTSSPTRPTARR